MTDPTTLGLFVVAAVGLLVTPGPAVFFVVTRSLEQGLRAGLCSQLGLCAGLLVHVLASIAGLSALLLSSAMAFEVVRLLGAGYLVWLGVRALVSPARIVEIPSRSKRDSRRLFVDGFVIDALNPKAALFFLAFLPQFIAPGPDARLQILGLGGLFVLLAFATGSVWAMVAATGRRCPGPSAVAGGGLRRLSGLVYLGLGAWAATGSTTR